MGFFHKIGKFFKKIIRAPIDLIKKAFKGDPLAIVSLAASLYGGYSLLARHGLTAAASMAAKEATGEQVGTAITGKGLFDTAAGVVSNVAKGALAPEYAGTVPSISEVASQVAGETGKSIFTAGLGQAVKSATGEVTKNMITGVTANQTGQGKGLFRNLADWWHGLENKDKLMALGMAGKAIGAGIQGYQQAQMANKLYKLKKEQIEGIGHLDFSGYKNLHNQAKMWYETDPALQKRVNGILQRMEDPEYRRGFYTLAGLLANPQAASFIQNDPYASLYS